MLLMNKGTWLPVKQLILSILAGALFSCTPMTHKRTDPLIGKIFNSNTRQEVTYPELLEQVGHSDVIYLGENHENADHHDIQRKIVEDLVKAGKKPQLGFEFFSIEQTSYMAAFVSGRSRSHHQTPEEILEQRLRRELGWQNRPDRTWQFYFGFLKQARTHQLTVFGADLPAGIVRGISRNGLKGLSPVEKSLLKPSGFKNDTYRKLMFEKFKAAHCGFAMKSHQEKMYETWLARNDTMANSITSMAAENPGQPVVVILGGGHTQHNMGVMERAAHFQPKLKQLNIGLTEIYRNPAPLEDYLERVTIDETTYPPVHDYLWFTQRFSYEDPCERFRKHLEAMKKSQKP